MDNSIINPLAILARDVRKNAIFSLENLSFAYTPEHPVLKNINLALFPGQSIGLTGSNGSGKTTLFRCITGLEMSQTGSIWLGEQEIKKDFTALRRKIGYVLQDADLQLFFPTVLEDLAFGPLNLGLSRKDALQRARETLELVGLAGYEERITYNLSGGEKKLAALAAILAMKPKAILLDEPLNELDENASARMTGVIKNLSCSKIIISHDPVFLQTVCATRLRLKNGGLEVVAF